MSNISQVKALNQKLLKAVSTGDWETYKSLCAEDLSCFEPETAGQVVEGLSESKKDNIALI
jgi:calcium/calmodulin-dependent protein kinase (CaM kinase) II